MNIRLPVLGEDCVVFRRDHVSHFANTCMSFSRNKSAVQFLQDHEKGVFNRNKA